MRYKYRGNNEACSCSQFCHGKAISNTYYKCAPVVLLIPHIKCIGHIILSSLACLSVLHFSTLPRTRYHVREKILTIKRVMIFSKTFARRSYHSDKNSARYLKCKIFTKSTRFSRQILIKHEFSRQILEKYSKTKFNENLSSGSRTAAGRTDIYGEAYSRFTQFFESAQ
jgi:hypothetical protein